MGDRYQKIGTLSESDHTRLMDPDLERFEAANMLRLISEQVEQGTVTRFVIEWQGGSAPVIMRYCGDDVEALKMRVPA